jgi:hypothetical protein
MCCPKIGGGKGWKIESWIFGSWIYTTEQVISKKLIPTAADPKQLTVNARRESKSNKSNNATQKEWIKATQKEVYRAPL